MTSRFRPFGWADFWAAVIVVLMLFAVKEGIADHSFHSWRIVEFEYVNNGYSQPIRRCVWECNTDFGNPHTTVTRGPAGGGPCPAPVMY